MKLGKLPARKGAIKFALKNYLNVAPLPIPPKSLKFYTHITDWQGMLGNDQYGDCVWAGGDHEHIALNTEVGQTIQFATDNALADYAACTGFNPNDPNTDQGTDMQVAASYRRRVGLVDAKLYRHRVLAYLEIQPGNINEVKTATYLFGCVGIGIQFPDYAMDQFNAGKSWHIQSGGTIDGGHYIPCVGYDSRYLYVVTWGKVQKMSYGFFKKYCDEAVVYIIPDFFPKGTTPQGFNLGQLQADLAQLT